MLTLKQITEETERVIKGLEKKHFKGAKEAIDEVIATDKQRRNAQTELDQCLSDAKKLAAEIGMLMKQGKNGRSGAEFIARLREYDNARRTIENPHEIWMDVRSRRKKYIRMTRLEDGRRVVNAVDQQGHVYSWHVNDRHFDYYRTGRLLYLR